MKINSKHLTAALLASAILAQSAFAGANWPSQPQYSAPKQTVEKQTTAKATTTRSKHSIATYVTQPTAKPTEVSVPHLGNIGNGSGL
jgi:hypothetical protein